MAGSGKTTLMQRLNSEIHRHRKPGYIINLDPAVQNIPYAPNIDIRDTVSDCMVFPSLFCALYLKIFQCQGTVAIMHWVLVVGRSHTHMASGEVQGGHETIWTWA